MARRPKAQPFSLARFLRDGLDGTGRTDRAGLAGLLLVMGALWAVSRLGPLVWPARWEAWGRWPEAGAAVPLALLLAPGLGHGFRRLNDMGWRGWWAWLLLVPYARLALLAALLAVPPGQRRPPASAGARASGLALAGAAGLALLGSLVWTTAPVLAGDMKPALLPGDLVLVRRAPVVLARGDVIAFRAGDGAAPRVARLVGLGGERVAMAGGRPVIDGAPAAQARDGLFAEAFGPQGPAAILPLCGNGAVGLGGSCETRRAVETLPGGAAHAVLDAGSRPLDDVPEVRVPAGHLWVLGDHRDAGRDSRLAAAAGGAGMVPVGRVLGRVDRVLVSSAAASPWDPRGWRPGRTLRAVE